MTAIRTNLRTHLVSGRPNVSADTYTKKEYIVAASASHTISDTVTSTFSLFVTGTVNITITDSGQSITFSVDQIICLYGAISGTIVIANPSADTDVSVISIIS